MKNENKLIKFYTRVLTSLGMCVSDDGYIFAGSGSTKKMMMVDNKPLVMPIRAHLTTLMDKSEDGEVILAKLPFNPIDENFIKGDSESLKCTIRSVTAKLSHGVFAAGSLLLTAAMNGKIQDKLSFDINQFLSTLSVADNQNIKKLVDDKSIESWGKLFSGSITNQPKFIKVFIKKKEKQHVDKFYRTAILSAPVYDELCKITKDIPIHGIKLRPKDITIFKLIFEFLLPGLTPEDTISVGSDDKESPAFITLMSLYIKLGSWVGKIVDDLAEINEEDVDCAKITIDVTEKELSSLEIYKKELLEIPNEMDLLRTKVAAKATLSIPPISADMYSKQNIMAPPRVGISTTEPLRVNNEPEDDIDILRKALYSNGDVARIYTPGVVTDVYARPLQSPYQQVSNNKPLALGQISPAPVSYSPYETSYGNGGYGRGYGRDSAYGGYGHDRTYDPYGNSTYGVSRSSVAPIGIRR